MKVIRVFDPWHRIELCGCSACSTYRELVTDSAAGWTRAGIRRSRPLDEASAERQRVSKIQRAFELEERAFKVAEENRRRRRRSRGYRNWPSRVYPPPSV